MKAIDKIKSLIDEGAKPEVKRIRYKHAAAGVYHKRKGYALTAMTPSGQNRLEYLTIEPVDYSNGDKWLYYGPLTTIIFGYNSTHYAKNIHQVTKVLKECFK